MNLARDWLKIETYSDWIVTDPAMNRYREITLTCAYSCDSAHYLWYPASARLCLPWVNINLGKPRVIVNQ
jgi:hypothetical protein